MNRNIWKLGVAMVVLYAAIFIRLNWIQVVQKDSLDNNPLNTAQVRRDFNRPRGSIESADGVLLAQSIPNPDTASEFTRVRVYPQADLFAQVTGYFSFTYGASGVERQYSDLLSGLTFDQQVKSFGDLFVQRDNVADITVSVRADAQKVARDQLGNREGSVVALDPRTGEVLAFWSFPSYDPNTISSISAKEATAAWKAYNADPTKPLRAHQYQERYFPGSTFKVVTSGIGLRSGLVTNTDPVYPYATSYTPAQTNKPISNFGGETCGGALPEILKVSCNSAFAEMGAVTIGPSEMVKGAQAFGFNDTPPLDLPEGVKSVFPTDVGNNPPKLAMSSIGQNDVQATPLEIALVAAGVANGGTIMKPHVFLTARDPQGSVLQTYTNAAWRSPLTNDDAFTLRQDMVGVVQGGTAVGMQIPGCEVGGKTGTAQLGTTPPMSHTWIMGFAGPPGRPPTVAIAVVVLNQSGGSEATGGRVAAPIARSVLQTILRAQGSC